MGKADWVLGGGQSRKEKPLPPASLAEARLIERLARREARVAVFGLGYVGLPLAAEQALAGFRVTGIDSDPRRVDAIRQGRSHVDEVNSEVLHPLIADGRLTASTDPSAVEEADVVVVCVPTPLTRNLTPDLQHVVQVTREIAKGLHPGQLVALESTTYPGTTDEVVRPILETTSGLKVEEDFFLVHSPERVDPGNGHYRLSRTSKVVGGAGPASLKVGLAFYGYTVDKPVPVSDTRTAELAKVFENTFRAVNIALVNEMAILCDRLGLRVWEVLEAAFTKPFGIMPFFPGPGVGGHCIPVDPYYLQWKAREAGLESRFITLAGEINRAMPGYVLQKVTRMLNSCGRALRDSRILLLGVAFKRDVADCRHSPAVELIRLLLAEGADVSYHDPFVPRLEEGGLEMMSVDLLAPAIRSSHLVVIATDHTDVDYAWVVSQAKRVLDTRNATKGILRHRDRITLL